jgi:hypothetical protein
MPLEPRIKYDFKEGVPGPGRYEASLKLTKPKPYTYYIGERLSDGHKVLFNNMTEFSKNNNLYSSGIGRCLYEGQQSHKGWAFRIANDEDKKKFTVNNGTIE